MVTEPNNLISEATDSGVSSAENQSITLSSSIDTVSDIDFYRFELKKGEGITLDIDTVNAANNTANFDSYLRVFDANGNELAFNDDYAAESEEFGLDSYAGFIANSTEEYYVGVSSVANQNYSPVEGKDVTPVRDDFVAGDYDLTLNIVEVEADRDPDNTIAEATATEVGSNIQNAVISGEVEKESDVDLYRFELGDGEGIKIDALADNSDLDTYLRLFDEDGNELALNDNSEDPNNITNDSAIAFAPEPGEYYVGVSSAGNFDYDEINGDTNLNFSPNTGISTGNYELKLAVVEVVADEDSDNTIAEAVDSGVSPTDLDSTVATDKIDSEFDVDLYQFELEEGEGVSLKVDTKNLNSDLDSLLRVFDAEGNELAFDDNNDANYTGEFTADSNLSFIPETPGKYYVGVGTSGNFDYDAIDGRTNFSSETTSPYSTTGDYELAIEAVEIVSDSDPDNTIAEAIDSGVSLAGTSSKTIEGEIDPAADSDLYQFELNRGEGITIDLDTTGADLDSYLRLFDSQGNELAVDNDDEANLAEDSGTDSLLNFAADNAGTYFVGVSSDGNSDYDAVDGRNNLTPTTGFTTGSYELALEISAVVADSDPDNTIAEAVNTEVNSSERQSTSISDTIDSKSDIDLYQVRLDRGDTVALDLDAAEFGSELDSVLQIFDAEGKELAINDDDSAPDENSNIDSYLEFTATATAEYYVGVSSFDNFDYDPLNGSSNFSNNVGSTTDNYDLAIAITNSINTITGTTNGDRLNGTEQSDSIDGLDGNDTISGAAQPDIIVGGLGDDSLRGNDGDDSIQGGKGSDALLGGVGNDTLDGNEARDTLYGNAGADIFVIGRENDTDAIADFQDGTDRIMLLDDLSFDDLTLGTTSLDVTTIGISDLIIATVANTDPGLITEADFIS